MSWTELEVLHSISVQLWVVSAVCLLTFGQLVKVDIKAQHQGAGDEAEGRADGGRSEEEAWKNTTRKNIINSNNKQQPEAWGLVCLSNHLNVTSNCSLTSYRIKVIILVTWSYSSNSIVRYQHIALLKYFFL